MGGQCCTRTINQGEESVRLILSDKSAFKLSQYKYKEVIDLLAKESEMVDKEKFRKLTGILFYDSKIESKENACYKAIFEEILSEFPEKKINAYELVLYLYPFLEYEDGLQYTHLYQIIKNQTEKIVDLTFVKHCLKTYIKFCTMRISKVFYISAKTEEAEKIKEDLEYMMKNVFSEDILEREIKQLLHGIVKNQEDSSIILESEFIKHMKKVHFSPVYYHFRDSLIDKYSDK